MTALTESQTRRVADRIFENECSSRGACLIDWNEGENFLSLGIGHFIWYPAGPRGPFDESFPEFVRFMKASGAIVPEWLDRDPVPPCPWNSRQEFRDRQNDSRLVDLRTFLASTKARQAAFLIERARSALPLVLDHTPAPDHDRIRFQFERVTSSPEGVFALIDYVNFKGLGILESERYQGEGWGLRQVLSAMRGDQPGFPAVAEFTAAARNVLIRRVTLSPPGRRENRWLRGWLNRVDRYLEPFPADETRGRP